MAPKIARKLDKQLELDVTYIKVQWSTMSMKRSSIHERVLSAASAANGDVVYISRRKDAPSENAELWHLAFPTLNDYQTFYDHLSIEDRTLLALSPDPSKNPQYRSLLRSRFQVVTILKLPL